MAPPRLNILHAIHDFLPRHQAGSEIYAFELCAELGRTHDVTVVCAEYDLTRRHGEVTWRVHEGIPVVEVVNNWVGSSFADTYRSPLIGDRLRHVLDVIQPDVLHIHNLLNLSFDLPRDARARGIPAVATIHDYTLLCPSGGQRLHRAEEHLCEAIDTDRCARCFQQSVFHSQMMLGRAASTPLVGVLAPLVRAGRRTLPQLTTGLTSMARRVGSLAGTGAEMRDRLAQAGEVLAGLDLVITPSPYIAAEMTRFGAPASRVRVSDYGFRRLNRLGTQRHTGPLRVGYVGTLVWHKGVHIAVEAMRGMSGAACELRIFGDPDVFPDYTADLELRATGLPVQFMGGFDRNRIADVYAEIDVLVVPSLWLENSPLVVHEAFMAGVPVVGSRIGGIPHLVTDGWNGLLFEAGSASDLAAALMKLIDDPGLVKVFASRNPQVKSIAEDAQDWASIYAGLMQAGRPGE